MGEAVETCAICGRVLPNRWAVAGRCEAAGCAAAFCAMHWHSGNRLCREHGWRDNSKHGPDGLAARPAQPETVKVPEETVNMNSEEKSMCEKADRSLSAEKKASILKQIGELAVKFGKGAGGLAKKLTGIRSTDEAMREIDAQIEENRSRREPVSKRYDELYKTIVAKKRDYQSAPPAKRKILEMELKSAIAEYQSLERQMAAYLKNETILTKVRGRMCELVAMNLKTVTESQIDKLTDRIEEAADANEDIEGAIGDLDKAGVRREREDSSFEDALAAFGDEIPAEAETDAGTPAAREGLSTPLADF